LDTAHLSIEVMARVWEHHAPATVPDLFDDTAHAASDRPHHGDVNDGQPASQGGLNRDKDARTYRYTAVASLQEYSARLMREAMSAAGGTEAVLGRRHRLSARGARSATPA
jgi:predicted transcriptional regulator